MELFKESKDKNFNGIYRGKVTDNNDTKKFGRIKIQVYPMLYDIESKHLPWAVPAFSLFSGAGSGTGSFCVPDINSFVFVFFEAGNYEQPVYFAEAQTAQKGIPTESQTNYPNRKVWKTRQGTSVYIDDSNNEININHPSGTKIVIDSTGKVLIESNNICLGDASGEALVKKSDLSTLTVIGVQAGLVTLPVTNTAVGTLKVKAS